MPTVLEAIIAGNSATIRVRDAVDENGAPFDFTGRTVRFVANRWASTWLTTEAPVIDKTSGITINGPGSADVKLLPAETAPILVGSRQAEVRMHWEIKTTDSVDTHTLSSGTVPVRRGATR